MFTDAEAAPYTSASANAMTGAADKVKLRWSRRRL
jgi:hypothetical protein